MNRNPVVPFILIMVFGIGLIFFLSVKGLGDSDEVAKEKKGGEKTEQASSGEFDPKAYFQKTCASCHGQNYEGGFGPSLKGVGEKKSKAEIKKIITQGQGKMPPGLVQPENADQMAAWVSKIK
ncbi:cytochrome c550 [Falsibacillus pallidus]|uniref:Cytochrome c550 n=1 Tax=Falsibacillus pallidus TaxID=493781 RepID=A0A370GL35_9BACI|nr:cytochrome c [Falsibacillus pallidus]RDI43989.1 cytochrome c550 [Falsibacillus pallidus]